jgi:tetratricopeptide (TPR) repeat protein
MHAYGTKDLQRLLGIRGSTLRTLIRAGHVRPQKGVRGRLQFTFQDLIVLRTARTLSGANVPARRIHRCLRELRAALPPRMPLSGLSITAVGDQVAVREGRQRWNTESGQYLLALEVVTEAGDVRLITRDTVDLPPPAQERRPSSDGQQGAHRILTAAQCRLQYEQAYDMEELDPAEAIIAYLHCLAFDRGHVEARLNCGRLLHLSGRLSEAERLYAEAPAQTALLLFNRGVLLEDLGRESEAMQSYLDALQIDPRLADAHFNLARLHERAGNRRETFRHLLAFKRARD